MAEMTYMWPSMYHNRRLQQFVTLRNGRAIFREWIQRSLTVDAIEILGVLDVTANARMRPLIEK